MTRRYGAKKDANHREIVSSFEKCGAKVFDISSMGCGVPDLCVWCGFGWHMVEIKNPKTGYGRRGFNPNQAAWIQAIDAPVEIVRTVEEAVALMNKWRAGKGEPKPFEVRVVTDVESAIAAMQAATLGRV